MVVVLTYLLMVLMPAVYTVIRCIDALEHYKSESLASQDYGKTPQDKCNTDDSSAAQN